MALIDPIYRPPSEAYSILLQITTGCSSCSCTFCGAYKNKPFGLKSMDEINSDIDEYAEYCQHIKKLCLMDGDALIMSNNKLIPILKRVNQKLPNLRRISSYANGFNITSRTHEELVALRKQKLELIYIGLESGSQEVLDLCKKKSTATDMVKAVNMASAASIDSSVMVILGLGGKPFTQKHIEETADAVNRMQPKYLSFLTLMLVPGTEQYEMEQRGEFVLPNSRDSLIESYEIIKLLQLKQTFFSSNHASNYLPLKGRLPGSKEAFLRTIGEALDGNISLKSDEFRGL